MNKFYWRRFVVINSEKNYDKIKVDKNCILYKGDCLEVLKGFPDNSIDLILTDPPYLHVKGGMSSKKYNTGTWSKGSYMTNKMSDFSEEEIYNFLDIALPKMKK